MMHILRPSLGARADEDIWSEGPAVGNKEPFLLPVTWLCPTLRAHKLQLIFLLLYQHWSSKGLSCLLIMVLIKDHVKIIFFTYIGLYIFKVG